MLGKLFKRKETATTPTTVASATVPTSEAATPARPDSAMLLAEMTGGRAIETLADSELLHKLLKLSDKFDKKTNRQLRERLQVLREQEKQQQQQRDKQEKLCTRLETMARIQHHPLFDSELAHLKREWQGITAPAADLAQRAETALAQCEKICAETAALLAQQHAAAADKLVREQDEAAARSAQEAATAAAQEARQQQLAEQAQKKQQSQAEREQQQKKQQEQLRNINQQLDALAQAIADSDSRKARELLDKLRNKQKQLDHKHAHSIEGRLHLLAGQLHELQDWQAFAALPKLEALCAEMEKLADTSLPLPQKADAVRELQNQWRAMKPPTGKQAQALWDKFRLASDRAWEPCAAHFDKEKQHRAFNLQQRQAICEALEQFFTAQNWEKADWKAVAKILEKAKQEFHDFHPVERNEEKGIRARFDAAFAAVNGKLLAEQQANEDRKRQLVEAAKSIATMNDLDKAVERVRQLQEQWKVIGLTRRHEDQKLWQQLQEQTAIVFDKRRANYQQQRQAEHDNVAHAKTLCEQIAALAKLDDAALAQSSAEFERLQAEYKAIRDIPEKSQAALKKQFFAACDAWRNQQAGIAKRQREQQLQELARRAALCARLEQQASDEAIAAVQQQWQQLHLPADWEQGINQRRERAMAAAQAIAQQGGATLDYSTNEQALRTLCIELEILLDAETPEEDRQQRRQYQMQKLQQGLGQAAGNRKEQLEQLQVRWHCSSPAAPATQTALQQRFAALLSQHH